MTAHYSVCSDTFLLKRSSASSSDNCCLDTSAAIVKLVFAYLRSGSGSSRRITEVCCLLWLRYNKDRLTVSMLFCEVWSTA